MKGFRSPARLARNASLAIKAVLLLLAADALWTLAGALTLSGILPSLPDGWDAFGRVQQAIAILFVTGLIFGAVTFIRWQRQLIRNLPALGHTEAEPTLASATYSWFIPFVNLIWPFVCFSLIAKATAPEAPDFRPLVGVWWITWILGNMTAGVAGVILQFSSETEFWLTAAAIDFASIGLIVFAGLLALRLVSRLSRQQEAFMASRLQSL